MKNYIVIVCNSINPDLVNYFQCKMTALERTDYSDRLIGLKNTLINLGAKNYVYDSSYTSSAFFDKKVPLDFFRSLYLFFLLLNKKISVIHFTTAHISNIFLSLWLKPLRIKQVFTIHDLVPHPGKKSFFIKLYNYVVINLLADEIITFSKKEIEKQIKKEKFVYFPLTGFDQYIDKPKCGDKTILFFGRIEPYKGINNLLDLIKTANMMHLDYKFIIAGKGIIENIAQFRKYNNVEIINRFISDDELDELFARATFTILPYDSATQSGVTILSYAYATPVIAYDVGALGEYIDHGKNGFMVKHRDNEKIINILKNLTCEDIKSLSNSIINEFDTTYSVNACQRMYKKYYNQIDERSRKND